MHGVPDSRGRGASGYLARSGRSSSSGGGGAQQDDEARNASSPPPLEAVDSDYDEEGGGELGHHPHSSDQDSDDDDDDDDDDEDDDDDDDDNDDATMAEGGATVPAATAAAGAGGTDGATAREGGASPAAAVADDGVIVVKAVSTLDRLHHLREIGREALCWQLSSAKPGNGVEQIRESNLDTYWQSDGTTQPHWIQVTFGRRVAISHVCLYLDYAQDESYTPKRLQVQVGMTDQDLGPAMHPPHTQVELQEPNGWCIIPLSPPPDPLDDCCNSTATSTSHGVVRAHLIRISILSMHQNGRDTHVRQVQLFGPRLVGSSDAPNPQGSNYPVRAAHRPAPFRTVEANLFSSIR